MPLRHIHLPSSSPSLFPPYRLASRLQHHLRRRLLDFKDSPTSPPPLPTLLTFTPPPTYTLGRRQSSTPAEINIPRLLAPLSLPSGVPLPPPTLIPSSPRGGLATYHGPGQIVLWPVLDLKSPSHAQFTVRCWARALEETTMAVVRGLGVEGVVVEGENPGVWVRDQEGMRKIAALGVHLRRFVTGLGVAVNVDMPTGGMGEGVDPWGRFVACGIEGRGVTSVRGEGGRVVGEEEVGRLWAGELARRIGVEGVEGVGRGEVMGLLEGVVEGEEGEEGPVGREEREYVAALRRGEV